MSPAPEDGASADAKTCRVQSARVLACDDACRWRRKMARRPAPKSCISHLTSPGSGAPTSCRWAALALVRTAPSLLGHRPTCHPIRKPRLAIVGLRNGRNGRDRGTTATLIRAALSMNSATPLLLGHRPACLPVCESILAIVGICRARCFSRLTADMMMIAAPRLLGSVPSLVHSHRAVVRINRSGWRRGRGWPSRSQRRGWRCGWRCRWDCRHRPWHYCGWDCRATTTHCCTAEVLLRLGPRQFCSGSEAGIAIVRQRCRRARQQPAEQRNEQQQTQKAAAREDASKISPRPHDIEIPTIPNIFVGGLLDVLSLSAANVGQSTTPCA